MFEIGFNCIGVDPVTYDGSPPSQKNEVWNYTHYECSGNATTTASTTPIEVFYSTSTVSSSSDIYIAKHITSGEALIAFLLMFLTIAYLFITMAKALRNVKKDKEYLQYGGGDVQIRKDL